MLPTFFVVGAMRCGTTSLCDQLGRHPQVFVTHPKEPRFFTENWSRGTAWYEALFDGAGDAVARGEGSVGYTSMPREPEAMPRMASLVPDARLVYLVRDPVDRIRSHYRYAVADGHEARPFEVAAADPLYVDRSRYALQVRRILEFFPPEQLLVTSNERLVADPAAVGRLVLAHLGVDETGDVPSLDRMNSGDKRLTMGRRGRALRRRWKRTALYAAVPAPARHVVRRALTRAPAPIDDAVVTPELKAQLDELLADDVADLRHQLGEDVLAPPGPGGIRVGGGSSQPA